MKNRLWAYGHDCCRKSFRCVWLAVLLPKFTLCFFKEPPITCYDQIFDQKHLPNQSNSISLNFDGYAKKVNIKHLEQQTQETSHLFG